MERLPTVSKEDEMREGATAYVVTVNGYDARTIAVYTDRELAESAVEALQPLDSGPCGAGSVALEEWPIRTTVPTVERVYQARAFDDSGDISVEPDGLVERWREDEAHEDYVGERTGWGWKVVGFDADRARLAIQEWQERAGADR